MKSSRYALDELHRFNKLLFACKPWYTRLWLYLTRRAP
jgi:hypothetical protein